MTREPASGLISALDDLMATHVDFFEHGNMLVVPFAETPNIDQSMWSDVELADFEAFEPSRGWARAALRMLTALADLHDASLHLIAAVGEEDPDNPRPDILVQEDLEAFYARNGFVEYSSTGSQTYMRRPPRKLSAKRQAELDAVLAGRQLDWQGPWPVAPTPRR